MLSFKLNRAVKRKKGTFTLPGTFLKLSVIGIFVFCLLMVFTMPTESRQSYPAGTLPSKYVKRGMRGYALSVFHGTYVERFPVVVVGKLKTRIGDSDMILVKLQGGYPVRHGIGVIAGMSGSPVYINGKLIGAIGYAWPFSKEAIGGVTPIENMMKELPPTGKKTAFKLPEPKKYMLDEPIVLGDKRYSRVTVRNDYLVPESREPGSMVLTPVPSMIQLQGFSDESVSFLRERLEPYGLRPVAVPGGARIRKSARRYIQPGSAIGVTFLEGDLSMSGVGTVTWRSGNKVLAFGHPMMNLGETAMPFNAAYIEGIIPSAYLPFKMASSMGIVGTLKEDRQFAVSGDLGETPPMIPITINVVDKGRNYKKQFKLRAFNMPYLTPFVIGIAGLESASSSFVNFTEMSAKVHYEINLDGYEPIVFDDAAAGMNLRSELGRQFFNYYGSLSKDGSPPVEFKSVKMNVTISPEPNIAEIEDISTRFKVVKPGDDIKVNVRLKTREGKLITKTLNVPIPPDVKKGVVRIGVTGGKFSSRFKKKLRIQPLAEFNEHQLIDRVRKSERGNELVVLASFPRTTVAYAGERLTGLPESKAKVFLSSPHTDTSSIPDFYQKNLKTPWVINGEGMITLRISKNVPAQKDSYELNAPVQDVKNDDPGEMPEAKSEKKSTVGERLNRLMAMGVNPVMVATKSKSKSSSKSKKVSTGSVQFALETARDYFLGNFFNTSITSGSITLGHKLDAMYKSKNPFIMAILHDDNTGAVYAAESPSGYLLKIEKGKKPMIAGKTREVLLPSMAKASDGTIYLGTGPNGRIFKKDPSGKFGLFCKLKDEIIWDIKVEASGSILAAAGNEGRLYRISPEGKAGVLFDPPETHATALALAPDGTIFLGCANEGTIYKIDPAGKAAPYYKTLSGSVDSLMFDNGVLWAASDELLYRIGNGRQQAFIFPEGVVLKVLKDNKGGVLVGTSDLGRVYRINEKGEVENLFEHNINQVTDLTYGSNGELIVASGNPGRVFSLGSDYSNEGYYLSKVFDTDMVSDFGRIQWTANQPKGTTVTIQTRSGNTSEPDHTWSEWSYDYSMAEGQKIVSPAARYLQVRANLKSEQTSITPTLFNVNFYFKNRNMAPILSFDSPKGGEKWSGRKTIKWKSYVANPETLAFSLYLSKDEGKTWKPIKENLDASLQKSRTPVKKPIKESHKWNTKKAKEGIYLLKLVGFDKTEPGNKFLRTELISKPILISNKKPEITVTGTEATEEQAKVIGFVKTSFANVKEVTYSTGGRKMKLAYPEDGIFDNTREKFVIYFNKPFKKRLKLKIKAVDEAGNYVYSTETVTFKVKEEKKEKDGDKDEQDDEDDDNSDEKE